MWIFDSHNKGCMDLWSRGENLKGSAQLISFVPHALKEPHAHWETIDGLESRFRVEECSFNTIFGTFEGHRTRSRPATQPSFATWMSGRIRGIWPKRISSHVEIGTNPGSRPILRLL